MPEIFAEREYEIEGSSSKIVLRIYELCEDDGSWVCPCQVIVPGIAEAPIVNIYGVDKIQAMSLAFQILRVKLDVAAEEMGAKITFMGDPRIDLI